MLKIFNTLSKKIEEFVPLRQDLMQVSLYACGPTVYDYTHIGHLRKYVMDDVLVRVLRHHGYEVKHVQNITDVGHLVSDDDEGEDKMEKGARKYGQTAWDLAKKFEAYFFYSLDQMNILRPTLSCRATEHIQSQLDLVLALEQKGFTYVIADDGVYFDTAKLASYGELTGHDPRFAKLEQRIVRNLHKKNPNDFALWKFEKPGENRQMVWPSPWHPRSFPGWHVECSAMSIEHLGPQIDIHTGGIDHIAVHHTNEIAQSETYTGRKPFARFWVHHNFLRVDGEKMSKSLGNYYTIDDIIAKGFSPMALRLLFLNSHYRSEQNFTFASLAASQAAWQKLVQIYFELKKNKTQVLDQNAPPSALAAKLFEDFYQAMDNDLNTAEALAVLWQMLKNKSLSLEQKYQLLLDFDRILGLGLLAVKVEPQNNSTAIVDFADLPIELQTLFLARETARQAKDYAQADQLRARFLEAGFELLDQGKEVVIKKIAQAVDSSQSADASNRNDLYQRSDGPII